jgi:hypothetical protein
MANENEYYRHFIIKQSDTLVALHAAMHKILKMEYGLTIKFTAYRKN